MRRLISELGLRYRPNERADLEAHAARLALLAADLADIPPKYLEMAINAWVARSPYLPKASDLIEMAKAYVTPRQPTGNPVEKRLAMLPGMNLKLATIRTDCVWDVDAAGEFYLRDL